MEGTEIKRVYMQVIYMQVTQTSEFEIPQSPDISSNHQRLGEGVWKFFNDGVTPNGSKEVVNRLTSDIGSRVNEAMGRVIGQY